MPKREPWYNALIKEFINYNELKYRRKLVKDKTECRRFINEQLNKMDDAILMLTKVQQFLIRTKYLFEDAFDPYFFKSDSEVMNVVRDYAKKNGVHVSSRRTYSKLKNEALKEIARELKII